MNTNLGNKTPDAAAIAAQNMLTGKFTNMLGIKIVEIREGYCLSRTAISPEHTNHLGVVHGGFLYSIADTTAGSACKFYYDENQNPAFITVTTVDGNMQFLRPSKGLDCIYCETEILKSGKRLFFTDVRIMSEDGLLLAKGSFTFSKVNVKHRPSIQESPSN